MNDRLVVEGVLELRIDDKEWQQINNLAAMVTKAFNAALAVGGLVPETNGKTVGATIVLADNASVEQLNSHWRSKPKPTNVLSFPAPDGEQDENGNRYFGDMIIAFGVVEQEALQQGKALETHLCHLIIHGALHLLGFDHVENDEAEKMESLERMAMQALDLPDPYLPVTAEQENTVK